MKINIPVIEQTNLKAKGIFYVRGVYTGQAGYTHMSGQMFVEVYIPKEVQHEYPLIFFHGAGQTNVNWMQTPDGRKGWADYFIEKGYVVYLAEQPARGRSAYHPDTDGNRTYHSIEIAEDHFIAATGNWPQAKLHTQWPEHSNAKGEYGYDQFMSAQVEYLDSNAKSQQLVLNAAKGLLEKTGPAILVTHSQAGPFGWQIADQYPESVRGIIAIEPSGPPFSRNIQSKKAENYGLGSLNMHFEPPVNQLEDFKICTCYKETEDQKDGLTLSEEDSHTLPNLADKKILILTGEASYHAGYDYLISKLLHKLKVPHEHVLLSEQGIRGNGHMMMYEKNNLEIAEFMYQWLSKHFPRT